MTSEINTEYRTRLKDLYSQIITSYGDDPQATMAGPIGRDTFACLKDASECGDIDAANILEWMARSGLVRDAAAYLKTQQGTVEYRNGSVRMKSMPARYGIRITEDDQILFTKGHQLLLWWEMPWSKFNRMVRDLQKQHQTLGERIEVFTRIVLPLQQRYPDSTTVGDACRLAGLDPEHLVIEVA